MRKGILIVALFIPFLSGCATVIHGTTQKIPVTTEPSGANVNVDGIGTYPSPVTLELQRKMDHLLTITKEGFRTEVVKIIHTISGAVAGNIIAGGLIGWGIDAASGGQYNLIPETVHVVLAPERYVEKPTEDTQIKQFRNFERDKIKLEYEKLNLERQKMGLPPVEAPENADPEIKGEVVSETTAQPIGSSEVESTIGQSAVLSIKSQENVVKPQEMPVVVVGQEQKKDRSTLDKRDEERRQMYKGRRR